MCRSVYVYVCFSWAPWALVHSVPFHLNIKRDISWSRASLLRRVTQLFQGGNKKEHTLQHIWKKKTHLLRYDNVSTIIVVGPSRTKLY
jgi:MFS-type transporter involved in bile tolerance (Atg22 family)